MNQEVKIILAIADHLGISAEDLDRHSYLQEELGLGPVELNDLLSDLSQKFNVSFNNEDVEDLKQVDDLIVLIEDNLLE